MDELVYVYVGLGGAPQFCGRLWARARKGQESASFEYDEGWLRAANRFSLEPALSLGPGSFHTGQGKALFGTNGDLLIAKFPHKTDETNVVLWEALALRLARKAGIKVPFWSVEKFSRKSVLVLERFDRLNKRRIPFLSAMSMLGAKDNETHSYLEVVDAIRQHGAGIEADLEELWRRIVFYILISNTDDHLRNLGFLCAGSEGWRLAPAYDLNPVPVETKVPQ